MEQEGFDDKVLLELNEKGWKARHSGFPVIGKVDAILVLTDGKLEGGADHRGDDTAAGF